MGKTLSDLVLDFFEFEEESTTTAEEEVHDGGEDIDLAETKAFWESHHQLLQEALCGRSSTEIRMQRDTEDAIREMGSDCVLRAIADRLRDAGHRTAAVCTSKWRRSPEIPGGEHSYIDAIIEPKNKNKGPVRIVIEPNFRAEFEMARANSEYNRLVSKLPEIFVGKSERLRNVIRIMCGAAKRCMKDNNMHMAPWRKYKYMQAKWLGTCKRVMPGSPFPSVAAASFDSDYRRPVRPRASMLTFDLHRPAVEVA